VHKMSRDALIVGINNYQYLPPLQAPANDAESVARCLESFGEYRVARMPEAIKANKACISLQSGVTTQMLEEALIKLFKPSGKNIPQQALFYYSGHGFQRNAGIQEGYLATSDVNPSAGIYGVSLYWLRRLLQESPVRQRIILLDCCHSGEFFNILEADPGSHAGTDRLFMAASREYEAAYESLEGSHSVFTKALLSGLNPYKVKGGIVNGHHLIDTVNNDLKGELQQPLFESSGSEIILTRASGQTASLQTCNVSIMDRLKRLRFGFCPFRGHQPFETAHGEFFFGREAVTQQLYQLTETSRLTAVLGASGIGKTSLLKAGLIPYLQGQGPNQPADPPDIRYLVPGAHPLKQLAEAFVSPQSTGLQRAEEIRQAESFLHQGPPGFAQLVQAVTGIGLSQPEQLRPMVLIIDQFEQLLPFEVSQGFDLERRLVIDCLVEVMRRESLPIKVVLSIRSDCLERLKPFSTLYNLVGQNRLVVPPMTYDQVKSTITGPLEKIGLQYDANLIYTLLLDAGGTPVDLSSLQLALKELWLQREQQANDHDTPRLTLDAYANTGGIRGMLSQHAGAVFDKLGETDRPIAQRILTSLCSLGDGNTDSRRQAQLCELVTPSVSEAQVLNILETLIAARLIVADGLPDNHGSNIHTSPLQEFQSLAVPGWSTTAPLAENHSRQSIAELLQSAPCRGSETDFRTCPAYYEITHDALVRHWPQLRNWINESRPILKTQQSLEVPALEWHNQNQPNHPDYFLTQSRLREAKAFQAKHPEQLSVVANTYLQACDRHVNRSRRKQWLMSLLIPLSMALGMAAAYGHSVLMASRNHQPPSPGSVNQANQPVNPGFHVTTTDQSRIASRTPIPQPAKPEIRSPESGIIRNGIWPWPAASTEHHQLGEERAFPKEFLPLSSLLPAPEQLPESLDAFNEIENLNTVGPTTTAALTEPTETANLSAIENSIQPPAEGSSSNPPDAAPSPPLEPSSPQISDSAPAETVPLLMPSPSAGNSPTQTNQSDNVPIQKVGSWISENDPNIRVELWCMQTETEPICFKTHTSLNQ
jgi:hypothetical protein